jgi:hypothetical protein
MKDGRSSSELSKIKQYFADQSLKMVHVSHKNKYLDAYEDDEDRSHGLLGLLTPYSHVTGYQHFRKPCCLHLHCEVSGARSGQGVYKEA